MTLTEKLNYTLSLIGKYYGYPQCCIDDFNRRMTLDKLTKEQKAVHNGEGFIPCPACAKRVFDGEIEIRSLITESKCTSDYPNDGNSEEMEVYVLKNKIMEPMVI